MAFSDALRTLSNQIAERRKHIATEEAVKQALILPFLSLLGFDIYNPAELIPEYKAGWAKATEKIDYCLCIHGKPVLFVEAKGPNEVLVNYDPQLAKYFNSHKKGVPELMKNGRESYLRAMPLLLQAAADQPVAAERLLVDRDQLAGERGEGEVAGPGGDRAGLVEDRIARGGEGPKLLAGRASDHRLLDRAGLERPPGRQEQRSRDRRPAESKSAAGHDFPNALTEDEKQAVLEYLKTL